MPEGILLIYPPFRFRAQPIPPPLVLPLLSAVLEKAKIKNVEALDFDVEFTDSRKNLDYYLSTATEEIAQRNPSIVCISCTSAQLPFVKYLIELYRQLHPEVKVIIGGWMPTLDPDLTLKLTKCDVVVRGEGEKTLVQLLKLINGGERWKTIDGISYIDGSTVRHNPNSDALTQEELDNLPVPNYDVLQPIARYQPEYKEFQFIVQGSRGCKNRECIFCWLTTGNCQTHWRARSPRKVVDEIRFLVDNYAANDIMFADDSFGADPVWLKNFTSLMMDEFREEVTYRCNLRLDVIKADTLHELYQSGLRVAFHGIESGSPHMLEVLGKDLKAEFTLKHILNLIREEVEVGILPFCSIIVGLPGETEDDIDMTIDFCNELVDLGAYVDPGLLTPHDGTAIAELYKDLIMPFDVWKEFGTSESFFSEIRRVFGQRLDALFNYLPDNRIVKTSMPIEVLKAKYINLMRITDHTIPPFF